MEPRKILAAEAAHFHQRNRQRIAKDHLYGSAARWSQVVQTSLLRHKSIQDNIGLPGQPRPEDSLPSRSADCQTPG
jgi:hypothetical protein